MVEDHFFPHDTLRIKSNTKEVRKLANQILSIGVVNKVWNIVVLLIYSQFGLIRLLHTFRIFVVADN